MSILRNLRSTSCAVAFAVAAAIVGLSPVQALAAPSATATPTAGTNGTVYVVSLIGGRIFVGGKFTWAGPFTGNGAVVNATDGFRQSGPKPNGPIRAVVPDGSGGWYLGGDFTKIGLSNREGLARITSSGSLAAWHPTVSGGAVTSLAAANGVVYVGGSFTDVNGAGRAGLAAVDASGGTTSWNPGANGAVNALAASPDGAHVYVGGSFSNAGGANRSNLASINSSGIADAWNPGSDGAVNALAASPDGAHVYVGGSFSNAGGANRSNLASINVSGTADTWNPGSDGAVNALTLSADGSRLFAGGSFSTLGGVARSRAGSVSTSTGATDAWDPRADAVVRGIAVAGSKLYLGGDFTMLNGAPRNNAAAIDALTGEVDLGWNPNADSRVRAIAGSPDGGTIYLGGRFTHVGGLFRNRVAAVDGATGAPTSWKANANDEVRALAANGTRVYVGGFFTTIAGVTEPYLAAIDATTGAVDGAFHANADANVRALAVSSDGSHVYPAGEFHTIGGAARPGGAELDSTGDATSFAPTEGGLGLSVALSPDETHFYFSTSSNRTHNYVPSAGNAPVWTLRTGGDVQAIAASASTVYVGGHFSKFTSLNVVRVRIGAVDAATGQAVDWQPTVNSFYGVWSFDITDDSLIAGGDFTRVTGKDQPHVAVFEGPT